MKEFFIAAALEPLVVPYDSLYLDPNNAREHPKENIAEIVESLGLYGQMKPIIVRADGRIMAGNGTYIAAGKLGATQIAAIAGEHLSDVEIEAYALADNKTQESSHFNEQRVQDTIARLRAATPTLKVPGWSGAEINEMVARATGRAQNVKDKAAALEEPDYELAVPSVVQKGDVWKLGPHLLYCGDCRDDVCREYVFNEPLDMIFTDPPYGVQAAGGRSQTKKAKGLKDIENDALTGETLVEFLMQCLASVKVRPGGHIYACFNDNCHWEFAEFTRRWAERDGVVRRDVITWNKNIMGLCDATKGMYRPKSEFIYFLTVPGGFVWHGGKDQSNVWDIARPRERPANHPTPKPVSTYQKALANGSQPGDTVGDMFAGSGPLLVAADALDRRARLAEFEPSYCDWQLAYYEERTGVKPEMLHRTEGFPEN